MRKESFWLRRLLEAERALRAKEGRAQGQSKEALGFKKDAPSAWIGSLSDCSILWRPAPRLAAKEEPSSAPNPSSLLHEESQTPAGALALLALSGNWKLCANALCAEKIAQEEERKANQRGAPKEEAALARFWEGSLFSQREQALALAAKAKEIKEAERLDVWAEAWGPGWLRSEMRFAANQSPIQEESQEAIWAERWFLACESARKMRWLRPFSQSSRRQAQAPFARWCLRQEPKERMHGVFRLARSALKSPISPSPARWARALAKAWLDVSADAKGVFPELWDQLLLSASFINKERFGEKIGMNQIGLITAKALLWAPESHESARKTMEMPAWAPLSGQERQELAAELERAKVKAESRALAKMMGKSLLRAPEKESLRV